MTSYEDHIQNGSIMGAFQQAVVYGALWSIGSAWSVAIREITRLLVPDDTFDTILAELGASLVTTVLGVGVSLAISHRCCSTKIPSTRATTTTPRPQTFASRP